MHKTRIFVDTPESVLVEPPYCMHRESGEMHPSEGASTRDISYIENIGWQLALVESSTSATNFHLPSGMESVCYTSNKNIEHLLFQKSDDSNTWDTSVNCWKDDIPPINLTDEPYKLSRCSITKNTFNSNSSFTIKWFFPSSKLITLENILCCYFSGPISKSEDHIGTGNYALSIHSNGSATLYELILHPTDGKKYIIKDKIKLYGKNLCSGFHTIRIETRINNIKHSQTEGFITIQYLPQDESISHRETYQLSVEHNNWDETRAYKTLPAVLDVRDDINPLFYAAGTNFCREGILEDTPSVLPFTPKYDEPLSLEIVADIPEGCTIESSLKCVHQDGTTQILKSTSSDKLHATYSVQKDSCGYTPIFTLRGNGTESPRIHSYRLIRAGTSAVTKGKNLELTGVEQIQLEQSSETVGNGSGKIVIHDINGDQEELLNCAGKSVRIGIDVIGSGYSNLFRGYVKQVIKKHISPRYSKIELELIGVEQRIMEQNVPVRYNWCYDASTLDSHGKMECYKITDIIRYLLHWCGFRDNEIDIPELNIRMKTSHSKFLLMDAYIHIGNFIQKLAAEYLNSMVIFKSTQSDSGCWQLRSLNDTEEEVKPIAHFSTSLNNEIIHESLPTGSIGKNSLMVNIFPPAASNVTVFGISGSTSDGKPKRFSITREPEEESSSLGRYVGHQMIDTSLHCPERGENIANHYYHLICKEIRTAEFTSQLLTISHDSAERILLPGDSILMNGTPWIINSIQVFYNKDANKQCTYRCYAN